MTCRFIIALFILTTTGCHKPTRPIIKPIPNENKDTALKPIIVQKPTNTMAMPIVRSQPEPTDKGLSLISTKTATPVVIQEQQPDQDDANFPVAASNDEPSLEPSPFPVEFESTGKSNTKRILENTERR